MASTPKTKTNLLADEAMKHLLHNATPAHLIDLVAEAREDKSRAEAAEKFLMEALKARLVDSRGNPTPMTDTNKMSFNGQTFKGENYDLTFKAVSQERIDTALLRAQYPKAAEECSKTIDMVQAKFTKKTEG
jgi:hypothetical protein